MALLATAVDATVLCTARASPLTIAQDMAKAEGAIIIAAICARFDLSLAPGQADPPEEFSSFTCGPKEFDMILTRTAKDE
ncbi:unnamed protein product [Ectocarpus sp. 12 AP-2014]